MHEFPHPDARTRSARLLSLLLLAAACTASAPAPIHADDQRIGSGETSTTPATSSTPSHTAGAPGSLFAGIELRDDAAEFGRSLADDWCRHGGERFHPVGAAAEEGDFPVPLSSCADIGVRVARDDRLQGLRATVFELDAPGLESREVLLLRGPSGHALVSLHHGLEDQSGEAGSYLRELTGVELRDLEGGATPEWTARVHEYHRGGFESDRCYEDATTEETLLVCAERGASFRCASFVVARVHESSPRPPQDLYECETPRRELVPAHTSGFRAQITLERGRVVIHRGSEEDIDVREDLDFEGELAFEALFTDGGLAVDALAD